MKLRAGIFWLLVVGSTSAIQYFYHPTIPLMVIGAIEMLVITGLLSWSAPRVGKAMRGGILLTVLSLVAGLMFNQGLDVAYSLLAAPAGQRLDVLLEIAAAGFVFLVFGLFARWLLARPKVEE
jgi:hypothetical protein